MLKYTHRYTHLNTHSYTRTHTHRHSKTHTQTHAYNTHIHKQTLTHTLLRVCVCVCRLFSCLVMMELANFTRERCDVDQLIVNLRYLPAVSIVAPRRAGRTGRTGRVGHVGGDRTRGITHPPFSTLASLASQL